MRNGNVERTVDRMVERTVERVEELKVPYQFDSSPLPAHPPDDREIGPMPKNLNVYQQILWLIESMADPRAHGGVTANAAPLAAKVASKLNAQQREHCVMMHVMKLAREHLEEIERGR